MSDWNVDDAGVAARAARDGGQAADHHIMTIRRMKNYVDKLRTESDDIGHIVDLDADMDSLDCIMEMLEAARESDGMEFGELHETMADEFKAAWKNGLPLDSMEAKWAFVGWQARESEGGEAVAALNSVKKRVEDSHTAMAPSAKVAVQRMFEAIRLEIESRTPMFSTTPQPDKWIPCSERLPTEADAGCFGNVWVSDKAFREPKFAQALEPWDQVEKVSDYTHWMPTGLTRPAPPEQESE